jgi:hypothetical protein
LVPWSEFARVRPELAAAGRELFHQFGVGLAFLATVRRDGAPRLHPICVVEAGDALYGLIIPSPKLGDLRRDGRCALHSYPRSDDEDAFNLMGRAVIRDEAGLRDAVIAAFVGQPGRQGPPLDASHFADQTLVEFLVESCLLTRTAGHGDPNPQHSVWRAPAD